MPIQRTLLERIRKPDPAGARQLHTSTAEIFDSILTNLRNILNTTRGNSLVSDHYGLPHMTEVRSQMPHSVARFENAIKATVEEHEPRLSNVRVRFSPDVTGTMALRFEISGLVTDEEGNRSVRFETYADDSGRMKIK